MGAFPNRRDRFEVLRHIDQANPAAHRADVNP
jgi:hypothetical protein